MAATSLSFSGPQHAVAQAVALLQHAAHAHARPADGRGEIQRRGRDREARRLEAEVPGDQPVGHLVVAPPPMPWTNWSARSRRRNIVSVRARGARRRLCVRSQFDNSRDSAAASAFGCNGNSSPAGEPKAHPSARRCTVGARAGAVGEGVEPERHFAPLRRHLQIRHRPARRADAVLAPVLVQRSVVIGGELVRPRPARGTRTRRYGSDRHSGENSIAWCRRPSFQSARASPRSAPAAASPPPATAGAATPGTSTPAAETPPRRGTLERLRHRRHVRRRRRRQQPGPRGIRLLFRQRHRAARPAQLQVLGLVGVDRECDTRRRRASSPPRRSARPSPTRRRGTAPPGGPSRPAAARSSAWPIQRRNSRRSSCQRHALDRHRFGRAAAAAVVLACRAAARPARARSAPARPRPGPSSLRIRLGGWPMNS